MRPKPRPLPILTVTALLGLALAAPAAGEDLPTLVSALSERLETVSVQLPDGNRMQVMASSPETDGFLTRERIETCLSTIEEADAWPDAWLVVQDENREFDLVMRIRIGEDETLPDVAPVFAAERREWDLPSLRNAARAATGRRPRGRRWNLVVQGFSKRIDTRFVYRAPSGEGIDRGLMALLPAGSILREARSVRVTPGKMHTLALILQDAEFLPSACDSRTARMNGHRDTGTVLAVLADAEAIVATLDLTGYLTGGPEGIPVLQRYLCEPGDETLDVESDEILELLADREPLQLIHLRDANGDGLELEFSLPPGYATCLDDHWITVGIAPGTGELRILSAPDS